LGGINVAEIDNNMAGMLRTTIPEIINSIKADIKRIMGFLQTYYSSNLLRVVPEVLAAVAGQFQQQGIGFSEITTKGGTNKLVFFDESELASIFEEILSNASDAMADASRKELTMDIKFGPGETVIMLSDTGGGLQATAGADIFSREYSTKGTDRGFGLFHARQQVERFGGRIKIYNNEGGPGATVELILKTVNDG
jgi:C4-dicarboxylate-specific signal transduction histidine kinase